MSGTRRCLDCSTTANGETIRWAEGDVFAAPGGEIAHEAADEAVLWTCSNAPHLAFEHTRPPAPGDEPTGMVHYPAAEIRRQIDLLYRVGTTEDIAGIALVFSSDKQMAGRNVLPTLTLGLIFLAIYLRIMRASMLEVLNLDFVRTARAKGLDETRIITRHVLRNALLPMVTLIGLQAGTMLGGSVVVESVFSLPGLGRLAYESVVQRDLKLGKVAQGKGTQECLEILTALKKLGEGLNADEEAFMQKHLTQELAALQEAGGVGDVSLDKIKG